MHEDGAERTCQLITVVPAFLQEAWADRFTKLIGSFRPAALVLSEITPAVPRLAEAARGADLALLCLDDADSAERIGLSGVHLGHAGDVAKARARLGSAAVIGASCGRSRHDAMVAGEGGADYVAFPLDQDDPGAAIDLSSWWGEVTEIPVALVCPGIPSDDVLAASRADFVMVRETGAAGESLSAARERGLASQTRD